MIMKSVAKSSIKYTCIFGGTATGECSIPVHHQLPTLATIAEHKKLWYDFCQHLKKTRGWFGHDEVRERPCGIGMNEKGGMNDEEFEWYINNTIIPLFPDMEDTTGKRVLLKVDSGPGRNFMSLLVSCKFHGLYLFPGLPNATSVQQETDRNYGLFKKVVSRNLTTLATSC